MLKKIIPFLAVAILTGCNFAQRTQIAFTDTSKIPKKHKGGNIFDHGDSENLLYQPVKSNPQVFYHSKPDRAYRVVAIMSVDGNFKEELKAVRGFTDLASRMGADGVIIFGEGELNISHGEKIAVANNEGYEVGATNASETEISSSHSQIGIPGVRYLYQAQAIVWTNEKK
jgi:hypothetical protein